MIIIPKSVLALQKSSLVHYYITMIWKARQAKINSLILLKPLFEIYWYVRLGLQEMMEYQHIDWYV